MGKLRHAVSLGLFSLALYTGIQSAKLYENIDYTAKEEKYIKVNNAVRKELNSHIISVEKSKKTIDSLIAAYPEMSSYEMRQLNDKVAKEDDNLDAFLLGNLSAVLFLGCAVWSFKGYMKSRTENNKKNKYGRGNPYSSWPKDYLRR